MIPMTTNDPADAGRAAALDGAASLRIAIVASGGAERKVHADRRAVDDLIRLVEGPAGASGPSASVVAEADAGGNVVCRVVKTEASA